MVHMGIQGAGTKNNHSAPAVGGRHHNEALPIGSPGNPQIPKNIPLKSPHQHIRHVDQIQQ